MGTHLRVLSESYLMITNMTGFVWFSENLCVLVLWTKVALEFEELTISHTYKCLVSNRNVLFMSDKYFRTIIKETLFLLIY